MNAPHNQVPTSLSLSQKDRIWGLVAVGLIFVGCLGPWATNGITAISGVSDGEGAANLGLAVFAGFLILIGRWTTLVGIVGVLTAIGGTFTAVSIEDVYEGGYGNISPGWGLIVSIVGGIALVAWAWWLPRLVGARPSRAQG